jgi:hypothetical protein
VNISPQNCPWFFPSHFWHHHFWSWQIRFHQLNFPESAKYDKRKERVWTKKKIVSTSSSFLEKKNVFTSFILANHFWTKIYFVFAEYCELANRSILSINNSWTKHEFQ